MAVCKTYGCKKEAKRGKYCYGHSTANYRKNNPIVAAYHVKKWNAKIKGIPFMLTPEQFKDFCLRTDYHLRKGQKPRSLNIDRIKVDKGYTKENIQAITFRANLKKEHSIDYPKVEMPCAVPF